jgi:hypothetical protein
MRERAGSALTGARGLASGCGVDGAPDTVIAARAAAGGAGGLDAATGGLGRSPGARAAGSGVALRSSWTGALGLRGAAAIGGAARGVAASSTPDGDGDGDSGDGGDGGNGGGPASTTSPPSAAACVRSTSRAVALAIGACALASVAILDRNPIATLSRHSASAIDA